jgi:hypothetical protein
VVNVQCEPGLQDTLYHYTDFSALQSIWEKGELWATNARYLNDITETQLGPSAIHVALIERDLTLANEMLQEVRKHSPEPGSGESMTISDADNKKLQKLDVKRARFREIRGACDHAMVDNTCYIFSLSREADQLSQWRAYAKDGVCIGFSTGELCDGLAEAPETKVTGANMQNVRYPDVDDVRADFSNPIIDFAIKRRAELIAEGCDNLEVRNTAIGQEMLMAVAFLKHRKFEEEKEVRLAVLGFPNHFTPHRYGIVPRIKLPIRPQAIQKIIVGPGAHAELRVQSLRTYFENQSFNNNVASPLADIDVFKSSIPYRDW